MGDQTQFAVFDAAHLAKYTLGDAAIEREVLPMFIDQAQALKERLVAAKNANEWHQAAHTLKGSARGVGAFRLGEEAARLETLSELPAEASALDALLGPLDEALEATRRELLAHIGEGGGA